MENEFEEEQQDSVSKSEDNLDEEIGDVDKERDSMDLKKEN